MGSPSILHVGSPVEVRSDEPGLRGVWFEASVLKCTPKRRRYTVSYASLVSDSDETQLLEENVHCTCVRPRRPPPPLKSRPLRVHQLVEAFYNDGWWQGVVSDVAKDGGIDWVSSYKYRVCFPSSREEIEFKGEDVREQLEWVDGKWVAAEDQVGEDVMLSVGSRVEVSRDEGYFGAAWFVGTVLKVIGKSYFFVEYESLRVNDNVGSGVLLKEIVDLQYIRPSPPPKTEVNRFSLLDEVEVFHKDGWMTGVVSDVLPGSRYVVKSKHLEVEIELDQTALRPHFDWTEEHWIHMFQDKSTKTSASKRSKFADRRRKPNAVGRSNYHLSSPTSINNDGKAIGESDAVDLKANKTGEPLVRCGTEISQPSKKSKIRELPKDNLKLVPETKSEDQARKRASRAATQDDESAFQSVGHSQPHKKLMKGKSSEENPQMSDDMMVPNAPTEMEKMPFIAAPVSERNAPSVTGEEQPNISQPCEKLCGGKFCYSAVGNVPTDEGNCELNQLTRMRRKQLVTRHLRRKIPDVVDVGESCEEMDVQGGSPSEDIERALASIVATTKMPPLKDYNIWDHNESGPSDPSRDGSSPSAKEDELALDRLQVVRTSMELEKAPTEITLPFKKESELWEPMELMEAFRSMPQQPHFNLVNMTNMELREGMAIGLMVTFANLVDDIRNLQITDPQDRFYGKLAALGALELDGFNTGLLRARLEKMLEIRSNAVKTEGKMASLKERILEREEEKDQLDVLIDEQDKVILKLREDLNRRRERRASIVSELNDVDSEVTQLKMNLQATEEACLSATENYNAVRKAPW